MGLEFVFELLKKFQDQGDKDEMKIINGEFYYKGQVMDKEARKLFYEEREKQAAGEVKSNKEEVISEDIKVMENSGEYTPGGDLNSFGSEGKFTAKKGRPPKIDRFYVYLKASDHSPNTVKTYGYVMKFWDKIARSHNKTIYYLTIDELGVPSGKRGITTLRIFLTIDAPFIFNVFRPFFIQKFSQVI